MDGHFSPLILLGRLLEVDLKSNMTTKSNELLTSASRFATPGWQGTAVIFFQGENEAHGPMSAYFSSRIFP